MRSGRRLPALAIVLALGALTAAGCGLTESGSARETLPPLPPPGGVLVNVPPLPTSANPIPTEPPTASVPVNDDADVNSVARFLTAVRNNDEGTATTLSMTGRDPTNYSWARRTFEEYTSVQGDAAWGAPTCTPAGDNLSATCTWLASQSQTVLVLANENGVWRVSYPRSETPTADTPVTSDDSCIAGDRGVNFRGGPGTEWPTIIQLQGGTCNVIVYDRIETTGDGNWRLIDANGQIGWVVERVLTSL